MEDLYVDDSVYVFSRGPFVVVMTNVGEAGPTTVTNNTVITIPGLPRRFHSSRLRNIYDKQVCCLPLAWLVWCGPSQLFGSKHSAAAALASRLQSVPALCRTDCPD